MRPPTMWRCAAGVLAAVLLPGCAALQSAHMRPTQDHFIREALLGVGTPNTADFWDRPGGYYADKLELLGGFRDYQQRLGETIQGLVVVGPTGELWQYSVLAFLKRGDRMHLNWVVFPHARITAKGVLQIEPEEYAQLLEAIGTCPGLQVGIPSEETHPAGLEKAPPLDARYDILAADWSTGVERTWYSGNGAARADLRTLYDIFDDLLERSTRTYGNYGTLDIEAILKKP